MSEPTVTNVKRQAGIAGQYAYSASVQYEGEAPSVVTFVANVSGGPIVMATPAGQTFVSRDVVDRLGAKLDEAWVRAFFGPKAGA